MDIQEFLKYFSRVLTLLLVIPVHEAAHGLVAKWLGDDTAERQGRITLNPFAHFDLAGSVLMIFAGFGWAKPVPVNPLNMKKYRAGFALTALAGPVSNLLAALVAGLAYNLMLCSETVVEKLAVYHSTGNISPSICLLFIFNFLFSINVGLAMFNLIPIPPLDGFNVLRYFTSEKLDRWFYMHQREISIGFIFLIVILNIVPPQYNLLSIVSEDVGNILWKAVSWIPRMRWGS